MRSQADIESARQRAEEVLTSVDPRTLSLAEQELLQEGFTQQELRRLCDIHLQVLSAKIEGNTVTDSSHPITILQQEHQVILGYLDKLQKIGQDAASSPRLDRSKMDELGTISQMLAEAESHHKREEDVLFPRLEQQGITGPPSVMRMEHEELRGRKKALRNLLTAAPTLPPEDFARQLRELADFIVLTLRSHIHKEDNILYPTALRAVPEGEWSSVKRGFDQIGYCKFTPHHPSGQAATSSASRG